MHLPASLRKYSWLAAAGLGLALRLFFVLHFPSEAGDTRMYEELARNWHDQGVYGLLLEERLTPVDTRVPGYPAFLVAVSAVFGQSRLAVMLCQVLLDMLTCFLAASLAGRLASPASRKRVATAALWLAALCPFTANYTAVVLTEVLATFLTTLALLIFVIAYEGQDVFRARIGKRSFRLGLWFVGGLVVGMGTLVRPETPLLVVAVTLALWARWRKPADWAKLSRATLWMAGGVILVLLPWGVRNWTSLGRVQFLAPRYAEQPGEYVPRGFYAWTKTWLVRFRDVYLVVWKAGEERINMEDLPPSAFDSGQERERVEALLGKYNEHTSLPPALDSEFARLARERTDRHPLRTYLWIPLLRAGVIWFTPRVELLPYSGHLWPPSHAWDEDPEDFLVTSGLGLLNLLYIAMAITGVWRDRAGRGIGVLLCFLVLRTAFLTQIEAPEPRYTLVCYPAILALASLAWDRFSRES
ncbi:MAG: glycosyltransferase family 39 protein [Acidobacteriia bacterium]|nr:glycosyltransferase family 39 protein [Terriglobia bacterium]